MSRRHGFFFYSCICVKVLFTNTHFLLKVEIISNFPLQTNVAFFLNQSFLSAYVNKVSHYNMAYSHFTKKLLKNGFWLTRLT